MKIQKRVLSLILTLAVLISSLYIVGINSFAEMEDNTIVYWDGVPVKPSGEGTQASPYLITNAKELAWAVTQYNNNSTYYVLTNDIYVNDVSSDEWYLSSGLKNWVDDTSGTFYAHLNGNGHTVYGLYYKGNRYCGIVPRFDAGSIKNIGIENSHIEGFEVGGIVGSRTWAPKNSSAVIENCYAGDDVYLKGDNFTGGIYGRSSASAAGLTVKNCYSLADVSFGNAYGGIGGDQWSKTVTITGCYTNTVFTSRFQYITAQNCYAVNGDKAMSGVTSLTSDKMQGENAADNMQSLDFTSNYKVTVSYPILRAFISETVGDKTVWNGLKKMPITDSDNDGYIDISLPSELAYAVTNYGDNDTKYELVNDIYINDVSSDEWYKQTGLDSWVDDTDGTFYAHIDGNGYTVYGLYYKGNRYSGIVPRMDAGSIKNIGIENSYIDGFEVGGIVGSRTWAPQNSSAIIENCYVGADVYLKGGNFTGGIYGRSSASAAGLTVKNCYSLANVSDGTNYGGIGGDQWSKTVTVTGCYTNTVFTSKFHYITAQNCYAVNGSTAMAGVVSLTDNQMQGIVASSNMAALDFEESYVSTVSYPILRKFADSIIKYYEDDGKTAELAVSEVDTFGNFKKPVRIGYTFDGFYTDVEFKNKASDSERLSDCSAIYVKWTANGDGNSVSNTYDEEGIDFTKIQQTDNRDYGVSGKFNATASNISAVAENGQLSQFDAWVEAGTGVDSSNALKITRARGYTWRWSTAVMLYEFDGNSFVPKANSYYKITLKYKLSSLKEGKQVRIMLRQKSGGKVCAEYDKLTEYGMVNSRIIDSSFVSENWVSTTLKFATGDVTEALYLAFVTDNNIWYAEELEMYVDNIEVTEITEEEMNAPYISESSVNTYDETDVIYTNIEQNDKRDYGVDGNFSATKSSLAAAGENGQFSQFDAFIAFGEGINGSNAIKAIRAHGYKKKWSTAVMLYDTYYNSFVPKANSYYSITLKYRIDSLKEGKQVNLRLRQKVDGKINVAYEDVVEYGIINQKVINYSCVSSNWVETTFKFKTGKEVEALYIAITSENPDWWAEELELYIDDIEINEITEKEFNTPYISPDSKNTYDEKNITYTKFEQTDKRDYSVEGNFLGTISNMGVASEQGRFSQYDAFVENGVGVGGSNALKAIRAHGYEKQWPTAVMLYDSNYNGFIPKANSYYQITLRYRLESLKEGKQVRIQLRQKVDGKVNVKYENVVDYGRVNEEIIDSTCVSDEWVETTFKFVTDDKVDELFLAFTTENNKYWAEELELYIDDIEIKQISYEEMGFDEGEKGRAWSGKIAMNYASGSGTKDNPYIIETPEQLAKCVKDASKELLYYKITEDIIINDTSSEDWMKNAKNWICDTENELVFNGYLDGDGHIISGLYYNITDGSVDCAALFPRMGRTACIEELGIVNSSITLDGTKGQNYAAAFTAFVESAVGEITDIPKLSECFADHTVSTEAFYSGGLVCAVASKGPIILENCYFTGTLTGINSAGSLLGNCWTLGENPASIINCYATTPDRDKFITNNGLGTSNFANVYIDSKVDSPRPTGVTYTLLQFMQGDKAEDLMVGFDFKNVWKTVENGTPVLRVFESDDYSSTRESTDVKIQFIANGGSKCEPISGQARSKLPELPTPTRYGYEFAGWYYFYELDVPCDLEVFPDFDTILYAKWIATGFTVDFEGNYNPKYDYNSVAEHHKPGVAGYKPAFNHNGMKSMHCMANSQTAPVFLLSYENTFTAGNEYEITLWLKTDSAEDISGKVEFLFSGYPDIASTLTATGQGVDIKGVSSSEWTEYKTSFIAGDSHIYLRTPKNVSLYLDDIQVVPTGKKGDIPSVAANAQLSGATIAVIAVGCAVGALLLAGITVITIVKIKKSRKAK